MAHWTKLFVYVFPRDTVTSVGIIPHRLPFTTSNTVVRTFRHAVALDEHRAKFQANLWNRPTVAESKLGTDAPSAHNNGLEKLKTNTKLKATRMNVQDAH